MQNSKIQLRYLANCGVLADCGGGRILIDALASDDSCFDRIPPTAERMLLDGCPPYDRIALLLYTHLHFDHFDLDKSVEFMENHPETILMLPSEAERLIPGTIRSRTVFMDGGDGALHTYTRGSFTVDYLLTKHITFSCPGHYCIRLTCGDTELIFTADMDFAQLPFAAERLGLSGGPGPVVNTGAPPRSRFLFFNPILLGREEWVREAACWGAHGVYIYHIPAEVIDEHGYRKLALRRFERYRDVLPGLELLLDPMENVELCNGTDRDFTQN